MSAQTNPYDEERLAILLGYMRQPPRAWVEAAAALPALQRVIEDLLPRAEAEAEARALTIERLEQAFREAGHEPTRNLTAALRARLEPLSDPNADPDDSAR